MNYPVLKRKEIQAYNNSSNLLLSRPWSEDKFFSIHSEIETISKLSIIKDMTQIYKRYSKEIGNYFMRIKIDNLIVSINSRYPFQLPILYMPSLNLDINSYIEKILNLVIIKYFILENNSYTDHCNITSVIERRQWCQNHSNLVHNFENWKRNIIDSLDKIKSKTLLKIIYQVIEIQFSIDFEVNKEFNGSQPIRKIYHRKDGVYSNRTNTIIVIYQKYLQLIDLSVTFHKIYLIKKLFKNIGLDMLSVDEYLI